LELIINNLTVQNVDTFKYLGRLLTATSNDVPAINHNAREAKKTWGRIRNLLKCEGADKRTKANFYKTIIQSILLHAAKTWQTPEEFIRPIKVDR
jgi:hypothetical protein